MEIAAMSFASRAAAAALLGILAAWSVGASAQQIYRIVGPDGRVTFSDRPPPEGAARATTAPTVTLSGANGDTTQSLPFELRAAANKYPVTLYSRPGCNPCDSGRNYLSTRGIPFAERTVTSPEDIEALQRLAGTPTLPFVTIGGQQLKGFSEAEWSQFLDAAGYPKTSQLPPTYRRPPAGPLVTAAGPAQPSAQAEAAQPSRAATPAPSGPNPANPAGIQF